MAKTIVELGRMSKKDRRSFLEKMADMLPDALGGTVVKAKRKRKKQLEKHNTGHKTFHK